MEETAAFAFVNPEDVAEEIKSTHKVEVVSVTLSPHPNADSLSIVKIWDYTVCVRTADWVGKSRGAYIVPDSLVPYQEPFLFLFKDTSKPVHRIKVIRLRGILSQGLLIPAPDGAEIGDNVAAHFGVTRYEPPIQVNTKGKSIRGPEGYHPNYDVDALQRHSSRFLPKENVRVTEKIHGANARFVFQNGEMWCGSHRQWKQFHEENLWWRILEFNPWIRSFCESNPGLTLYGEVFGRVQTLHYGVPSGGQPRFLIFDVLRGSQWLEESEVAELSRSSSLEWVPTIYEGPFDKELLQKLSEGPSLVDGADNIREGIVVEAIPSRFDVKGRIQFKLVSNQYLEKNY